MLWLYTWKSKSSLPQDHSCSDDKQKRKTIIIIDWTLTFLYFWTSWQQRTPFAASSMFTIACIIYQSSPFHSSPSHSIPFHSSPVIVDALFKLQTAPSYRRSRGSFLFLRWRQCVWRSLCSPPGSWVTILAKAPPDQCQSGSLVAGKRQQQQHKNKCSAYDKAIESSRKKQVQGNKTSDWTQVASTCLFSKKKSVKYLHCSVI